MARWWAQWRLRQDRYSRFRAGVWSAHATEPPSGRADECSVGTHRFPGVTVHTSLRTYSAGFQTTTEKPHQLTRGCRGLRAWSFLSFGRASPDRSKSPAGENAVVMGAVSTTLPGAGEIEIVGVLPMLRSVSRSQVTVRMPRSPRD